MKISFNSINPYKNNNYKYYSTSPLKNDVVSFGAMKKAEFKGLDAYAVERFKAPIEKFRSNEDLQNWAKAKYEKIINTDFGGRSRYITERRNELISEWADYIIKENDAYTDTQRLIILSGITKDLGNKDEKVPPNLNKGVLAQTIEELDKRLKINPKHQFNFNKVYTYNLANPKEENIENTTTGWVIIPSKIHDEENFENNVGKLKALSHHNWCTKTLNAEPYLRAGDFHVYLEDGKPKVGIRFLGDKVKEIQGEKNNSKIPIAYYNQIVEHIESNNIQLNDETQKKLEKAKEYLEKYNDYKEKFKILVENNDTDGIIGLMGIKYKKDENGFYTISHYCPSFDGNEYTINDFGVKETKLFDKIKEIEGNANFEASHLTTFKTLKKIGGNANFEFSQLVNLGSLEEIGRTIYIINSPVVDLGNLRRIGGDFSDYKAKFESLCNVEEIGGFFKSNSSLKDLGKLKKVGGTMMIERGSPLTSFGELEEIGWYLVLESDKINSLGKLKRIGGELHLFNKIKAADNIEEIGSYVSGMPGLHEDEDTSKCLIKLVRASDAIKKFGFKDYQRNGIWQDKRHFLETDGYYNGQWSNFFKNHLEHLTIEDIDSINIPEKLEELSKKSNKESLKKEMPQIIEDYKKERSKY